MSYEHDLDSGIIAMNTTNTFVLNYDPGNAAKPGDRWINPDTYIVKIRNAQDNGWISLNEQIEV